RDAEKERAGARGPEGIALHGIGVQHLGDALQIVDALYGVARHVVERIPVCRAAVLAERIEEATFLAAARAIARGECPVLALDVNADERVGPVEQIRHHHADALPCSRRRGERYSLLTWQHETASTQCS